MVENEKTSEPSPQEYAGVGFIVRWSFISIGAVLLAFFVRVVGYEHSPLPYYSLIPSHAFGTAAVVSAVIGCFLFVKGHKEKQTPTKRQGALFCFLGIVMLAGFFMFPEIMVPLFGEGVI